MDPVNGIFANILVVALVKVFAHRALVLVKEGHILDS